MRYFRSELDEHILRQRLPSRRLPPDRGGRRCDLDEGDHGRPDHAPRQPPRDRAAIDRASRSPSASSTRRRRSDRSRRRASGSRSTAASSRASRARRSSRSAATTGSRSRPCATSPSCPASGRAGCASSRSRARSTRRSRARATCEPEMKVQTQTEELRRLRRTNLELIFSRPQRLLPAALPEQVPEPHRHPGLPQGQRRGRLAREHPDLQADDPVPERPRPRLPGAVRGALPARRGRRGDRHPRQPPLRRRPGPQVDARRGRRPAAAVRAPGADRAARRGHRLRAGRHGRRVLPAARRPRRDGLRARPGARRDAPLRHPAVPPAQGRGPRGRVRVGHPARRQDRLQRRARASTSRSTT